MQPIWTPLLKGRAVILRIEDKLPLLLLVKTVTFLSCLTVSVSIVCAIAQTNTLPVPSQEKLADAWRRADVDLGGSVIMPICTCNIYIYIYVIAKHHMHLLDSAYVTKNKKIASIVAMFLTLLWWRYRMIIIPVHEYTIVWIHGNDKLTECSHYE